MTTRPIIVRLLLFILLFSTILSLQGQDTSSTRLIGKWLYLKTTVQNPNIKIGSGSGSYLYEFFNDSLYKLHYGHGKSKTTSQGKWYIDNVTLHLSENMTGRKDKGSLADAHDFTLITFTELELVVQEGGQKKYFKRQR